MTYNMLSGTLSNLARQPITNQDACVRHETDNRQWIRYAAMKLKISYHIVWAPDREDTMNIVVKLAMLEIETFRTF